MLRWGSIHLKETGIICSGGGTLNVSIGASVWSMWDKKHKDWEMNWSERLTGGKLVEQMGLHGIASAQECQEMVSALRKWMCVKDAVLSLMNCELIAHKAPADF